MNQNNQITIDSRLVDLFVTTWNEMANDDLSVHEINRGWCYQIAIVFRLVYGGKLVTPGYWHAWVRIDGRDYDSMNLDGSDSLASAWNIKETEVKEMHQSTFKSVWGERGNSGKVRMDIIKETVKRYKALTAA